MMKAFTFLAFLSTAIASPLLAKSTIATAPQQGREAILDGLNQIGIGVDRLTSDLDNWKGEALAVPAMLKDLSDIDIVMAKSAKTITDAPPIGIFDAIQVLFPALTLDGKVASLTQTLAAKYGDLEKVGKTADVKDNLAKVQMGTKNLAKAITRSMPAFVAPVSEPLAQGFVDKLDGALRIFGA